MGKSKCKVNQSAIAAKHDPNKKRKTTDASSLCRLGKWQEYKEEKLKKVSEFNSDHFANYGLYLRKEGYRKVSSYVSDAHTFECDQRAIENNDGLHLCRMQRVRHDHKKIEAETEKVEPRFIEIVPHPLASRLVALYTNLGLRPIAFKHMEGPVQTKKNGAGDAVAVQYRIARDKVLGTWPRLVWVICTCPVGKAWCPIHTTGIPAMRNKSSCSSTQIYSPIAGYGSSY